MHREFSRFLFDRENKFPGVSQALTAGKAIDKCISFSRGADGHAALSGNYYRSNRDVSCGHSL